MQLHIRNDLEHLELQTFEVEDLTDLGLMAPQELVENTNGTTVEQATATFCCSCSCSSCCSCSTSSCCSCSCATSSCSN